MRLSRLMLHELSEAVLVFVGHCSLDDPLWNLLSGWKEDYNLFDLSRSLRMQLHFLFEKKRPFSFLLMTKTLNPKTLIE